MTSNHTSPRKHSKQLHCFPLIAGFVAASKSVLSEEPFEDPSQKFTTWVNAAPRAPSNVSSTLWRLFGLLVVPDCAGGVEEMFEVAPFPVVLGVLSVTVVLAGAGGVETAGVFIEAGVA